jgi:hypothetical protein
MLRTFNGRKLYGTSRQYRTNLRKGAIWLRNYMAAVGFDDWDIHPNGRAGHCKHGASHSDWYGEGFEHNYMIVWRCDYCHAVTRITAQGDRCDTIVNMNARRDGFGRPLHEGRLILDAIIPVPMPGVVSYEMVDYERIEA